MRPVCFWVLANGEHCGRPVSYTMVEDGGEPGAHKVRKYAPFCASHQAQHEAVCDG